MVKIPTLEAAPTRREVCTYAWQIASIVAAGALTGCGGGGSSPSDVPQLTSVPATASGRTVSVPVASGSPLFAVGSAATTVQLPDLGTFLLAHTGDTVFTAMTAICTHEQCTINGFSGSRFVCPCHGSQFTTAGAVAMGPAASPLKQFATTFADGVVTFNV
jgi:Rieske Fe-S protein